MPEILKSYNEPMYFYHVLVATQRYHGSEPLTYHSEKLLKNGALVEVKVKDQKVLGVIAARVDKPSFKTKPLGLIAEEILLPRPSFELLNWLRTYYPASLGVCVSLFLPSGLLQTPKPGGLSTKKPKKVTAKLPTLTDEQRQVVGQVNAPAGPKSYLLHGETGSGKTRIYLELAKKTLVGGKNVLILTPEISLTPQLVKDFEKYIDNKVLVVHSNLTISERRQIWLEIYRAKQPLVVIGPRSALFAPFSNLGLIVVDEMHEPAYKQEQAPYYNSLRVAAQLAKIHDGVLVAGSATPTITEYYFAKAKDLPILRMKKLALPQMGAKPKISVVSAAEKSAFSVNPYLSDELISSLRATLAKNQQALIFLNRRGSARAVLCQNCGWQAVCPNCNLGLTYHSDSHLIRCHTCGHKENSPVQCPVCSSNDIIYRSVGTKSLVYTLGRLFPSATIQRFDADNKKNERFEQHYHRVLAGEVDIIVGTQLLIKGLDLPKLALVGVVSADTSLSFPDYTAEERTYQLLSQILGRVGRGHTLGKAVIQTYYPDGLALQAAVNKDWPGFYQNQIEQRRKFLFPPFCHVLKLTCTRKSQKSSEAASQKLAETIKNSGRRVKVIGPSPSFYEKSSRGYSWQLIIKSARRSDLLEIVKALPAGWLYDLDPTNLL